MRIDRSKAKFQISFWVQSDSDIRLHHFWPLKPHLNPRQNRSRLVRAQLGAAVEASTASSLWLCAVVGRVMTRHAARPDGYDGISLRHPGICDANIRDPVERGRDPGTGSRINPVGFSGMTKSPLPASPAQAGVSRGWLCVASAGDPGICRGSGVCRRECRQFPQPAPVLRLRSA